MIANRPEYENLEPIFYSTLSDIVYIHLNINIKI
jgi:hypothetical protein